MKNYRNFLFLAVLGLILTSSATPAQQVQRFSVLSGTGFFINRGYVVTNAHVVEGCNEVLIKGAVPERKATVKARDKEQDLALIATDTPPQEFAPLRFNIDDLKVGDKVTVIGYPGEAGARGEYKVATAKIENIQIGGENGKWLYISNVVDHGNSGGPVFDTSGNVIGVVVAKAVVATTNLNTKQVINEQAAGVAITLKTLEQFLLSHGAYSEQSGSGIAYADSYIEQRAKNYIVNVQCIQPVQ